MADYLITWVDYALDQRLSLEQPIGTQLDERLRLIAQQPTRDAHYDQLTDHWTVEFDAGHGLVVYIVNEQHRRVVILRIVYLG